MSLSDTIKKRLKGIVKELQSKEFKKEVGTTVSGNIKKRTRLGRASSEDGGKASKIKALSEGYKKQRKRMRKKGTLSTLTTPAKSNLTKTGSMLDSIDYSIGNGGKVSVEVTGSDEIRKAKEVEAAGRPFMYLTNLDIKEIRDLIRSRVLKHLK